jgi:hypothetical protein
LVCTGIAVRLYREASVRDLLLVSRIHTTLVGGDVDVRHVIVTYCCSTAYVTASGGRTNDGGKSTF